MSNSARMIAHLLINIRRAPREKPLPKDTTRKQD